MYRPASGTAIRYYYARNAQGDIIGIVNSSGTMIIRYVYDSWGKLLKTRKEWIMVITNILYFNKDDSEAEVCISDGSYNLNCYVCPAENLSVGNTVNMIYGLECKNITRSCEAMYKVKKLLHHYAYLLTAQVIDMRNGAVRIGSLFINLDSAIPNDIVNGEYITFSVVRLDCS